MSLARPYHEVKCPCCGWVHASVPPNMIDMASASEREGYFRCFNCGHPSTTFVPAGPGDAPTGTTLQPVVIPERHSLRARVIALDLEGTLISSAVSQFPRPHLFDFLVGCRELVERIVMFTTVREARFRSIAALLVREGHAPPWFASLEYISWSGSRKDLSFVPSADVDEVLLVDDVELYVQPSQISQWVPVQGFEPPGDDDVELLRALRVLRERTGLNR